MTKLESIVVSNTEPNSKNVLWYDNKRLLIFSNGHWSPIVDLDDIDVDNVSNLQEALKSLNIKVDNKVDKVELDKDLTAKQDKLVNSDDVTIGIDNKLTVTDLAKKKVFIDQWKSLGKVYNGTLNGSYDAENDKFNLKWDYSNEHAKKYMPSVTYESAVAMMQNIRGSVLAYDELSVIAPANLPPKGYQFGSGPQFYVQRSEVALYNQYMEVLILATQANGLFQVFQNPIQLVDLSSLKAVIGVATTGLSHNPLSFTKGSKAGFPNLEFFRVQIKQSFDVRTSPLLTLDTMQYLVTYAQNPSPITVTVHPDVYAKLTGDTANAAASALTADELAQWQALVTTANNKNISFATTSN